MILGGFRCIPFPVAVPCHPVVTENGNRGIRHGLAVEEVDEGSRQPIGAKSRSLCEMGRCPSGPLHSSRASGTKTFILRYRPAGTGRDGPKRFLKIGRYGPLTPDEARRQAREILGQVASCKDPTADLAVGRSHDHCRQSRGSLSRRRGRAEAQAPYYCPLCPLPQPFRDS